MLYFLNVSKENIPSYTAEGEFTTLSLFTRVSHALWPKLVFFCDQNGDLLLIYNKENSTDRPVFSSVLNSFPS